MSTFMKMIFYFVSAVSVSGATTICKPIVLPAIPHSLIWQRLSNLGGRIFPQMRRGASAVPVTNICVYSNNPDKFKPRCFLCPNDAYPNILKACSEKNDNSTNDVDFDQASCIEKNCQVNYPTTGNNRDTIHVGGMQRQKTARLIPLSDGGKEDFYQTATTACDSMVISESQPRRVVVAGKEYMVTRCEVAFAMDKNQTRTPNP